MVEDARAGATRRPCRSCANSTNTAAGPSSTPPASATAATSTTTSPCPPRPACTSSPAPASSAATPPCRSSPARASTTSPKLFIHEITVGIGNTGAKAGVIKVGVSRGGRMTDLDKRIYRAAARAAVVTGAPILTHLAIDAEPAIDHLQRRGPAAGPRALRPRRRRPERSDHPARLDLRAGRPHRLRHLRLRPRAAGPAVLGPQRARSAWTTSCNLVNKGYVGQAPRLGRRQLQPAGLAGREGPHRQLHLRGPDPRPARGRHRRRHHHNASSSTTRPTSCHSSLIPTTQRPVPPGTPGPRKRQTMKTSDIKNLKIAIIGGGYGGACRGQGSAACSARERHTSTSRRPPDRARSAPASACARRRWTCSASGASSTRSPR